MTHEQIIAAGFVAGPNGQYYKVPDSGGQGKHPVFQEQQNAPDQDAQRQTTGQATPHHEAGISEANSGDRGQFRITITVRFSDRRRTDLDGKLSALCDCIVRARRRLLDTSTGDSHPRGTLRPRSRRSNRPDRKAVTDKVPF